MIILSIDVGIRNLAFCVIDSNTKEILFWDTISLIEIKKCDHCNVQAKFTKNNNFYCLKHSKISQYELPNPKLKNIKKLSIKDLQDFIIKNYNDIDIDLKIDTNFKKMKKKELISVIENFTKTKYLDYAEKHSCSDMSLIQLGINLKYKLNNFLLDLKTKNIIIDKVLIENQLSSLAIRMKSLQGMLTQYFIMADYHDIEYISSSNKLKILNITEKTTYSERKKLSILYCKEILTNYKLANELELLNKSKKKDDLSDCLLQAIYFINTLSIK